MSLAKFIVYVRCDSVVLSRITALVRKRESEPRPRNGSKLGGDCKCIKDIEKEQFGF